MGISFDEKTQDIRLFACCISGFTLKVKSIHIMGKNYGINRLRKNFRKKCPVLVFSYVLMIK